jgi:cyclophilin family peptidyl-prolyl cis-trans isomerase
MAETPSRLATFFISLALLVTARGFEPTEDGLYAVFDTSEGEFTAALYFEQVPITVANFVGLAENSISHFDVTTGEAQNKPFYNGLTFHRIIGNFVIQAGSPNGTGSDGPGYSFADEIETDLKHNAKGILSMANAGPNTNGSQFFITLSSETATHLDGRHAVFGLVVDGINVVDAIGLAPTNTGGAPITPITINSVSILRVGAAAAAFQATDYMRPFQVEVQPSIEIADDGSASVSFPRSETLDYFLYRTLDFQEREGPHRLLWDSESPEIIEHEIELPEPNGAPVFYYYSELALPWLETNPGFTVTFELPAESGFGPHTVNLGDDFKGTFTSLFNPDESLECDYAWYDLGNRIQIYFFFPFESWYEVQVHLDKDSLDAETAFMTVNDPFWNQDFSHTGAFSFAPTETP